MPEETPAPERQPLDSERVPPSSSPAQSLAGVLRIGLFSESFRPVQNGVTTSLLTLIDGLRSHRHRVWVFAPDNEQQTEPETNVLRFPSFVTSLNPGYPLAYPFLPRIALTTQFNRLRLDVVHTHTPFVLGLTGANLAISRGIPLVTTFHTLYSQYSHYVPLFPDSMTQNLLEVYLPWYYNRCAAILCPSEIAARALRSMGVESSIHVVPTGIALPSCESLTEESTDTVRQQMGLAPETPMLLFAGRLAQEKNVSWLFETFRLVLRSVPEAKLVIAGDGPYREDLELLAETLGVQHSIIFLGAIERKRMDPLLAAADVFCFPSPSETQGLVIGEARAAGTPSVVIDAGGAPETVQEGIDGFRVPEGDQALFARRICELLCNRELRARMSENARRNAIHFVPEKMIDRIIGVYDTVRSQTPPNGLAKLKLFSGDFDWENFGQSIREKLSGSPRLREETHED